MRRSARSLSPCLAGPGSMGCNDARSLSSVVSVCSCASRALGIRHTVSLSIVDSDCTLAYDGFTSAPWHHPIRSSAGRRLGSMIDPQSATHSECRTHN